MVFVIDDSDDFLEIFEMLATELGQSVRVARSGKEGMALFESADPWPGTLFLDFFLPDTNGEDFLSQINAQFPNKTKEMQVVVLSNLPLESPQLRKIKTLVNRVAPKPSDLGELKSLILEFKR